MKPNSWAVYRRLLSYVKPFWMLFVWVTIGNIVYASVDSYSMYLFKPLLDKGFVEKDTFFLQMLPLIVLGLFILRGSASFVASFCLGKISRKIVMRFRAEIFDRLLVLPAHYYDQTSSGQLLSKVIYNVDQVTQATGDTLTTFVRQGAFTIGLLIVMFIMSWQFTLFIFIVLPFIAIAVAYASKRFRRLSRSIQTAMGQVTHTAEETIVGYREVRIFGGQAYQRKLFRDLLHHNYSQEIKIVLTDALNTPIVQLMGACVLALILFVAFRHGNHDFSPGRFAALLSAMLAILKPVRDLTKLNSSIQKGLAAAEGIFDLLDRPAEKDEGQKVLTAVRGNVQFDHISFSYRDDSSLEHAVLRDVSLSIPAGKTVALVGRSGSGKTTLVSLLARFYEPNAGRILLDGINIHELTLSNLRQQIAVVSQHVTLFDDTLLHNIAYGGDEVATEAQVIAAAKAAHAWDFIERLPQGLHTPIGENGLNLSGGQRQRVAIARAILKNAPILVLDEATSALDNESERAVQEALETLKKGRTTLVIAHRLSTIEKADQIVVMDQGRVIETGSHAELLAKQGAYAALQSQR